MIRIFACGDILNSKENSNFIDDELKGIISKSDIALCNYEAPIETHDSRPIKKVGTHLKQSKESIKYLNDVGFNFVTLANNHIYDYGQKALSNTIKELIKYDIEYIGAGVNFDEAYKTKIVQRNGLSIGFLAASENEFGCLYETQKRGGYAWLFHPLIEDNIRKLKGEVDFVILLAHAGVEDIDFPIKEWRDRYQRLCEVGVDIIIGHHPHVPQGYELYQNKPIFYSLGNFYFDAVGYENKSDDSYSIVIDLNKSGIQNIDMIYHKKMNWQTRKVQVSEVNFSLEGLNKLLFIDYEMNNDRISIKLFNDYYFNYYESALGKIPNSYGLKSKLLYFIREKYFPSSNKHHKNLLLLHNIRIDSHRFLVQRALSLMSED